jgi:hypothetical protein
LHFAFIRPIPADVCRFGDSAARQRQIYIRFAFCFPQSIYVRKA